MKFSIVEKSSGGKVRRIQGCDSFLMIVRAESDNRGKSTLIYSGRPEESLDLASNDITEESKARWLAQIKNYCQKRQELFTKPYHIDPGAWVKLVPSLEEIAKFTYTDISNRQKAEEDSLS